MELCFPSDRLLFFLGFLFGHEVEVRNSLGNVKLLPIYSALYPKNSLCRSHSRKNLTSSRAIIFFHFILEEKFIEIRQIIILSPDGHFRLGLN